MRALDKFFALCPFVGVQWAWHPAGINWRCARCSSICMSIPTF